MLLYALLCVTAESVGKSEHTTVFSAFLTKSYEVFLCSFEVQVFNVLCRHSLNLQSNVW